MSEVSNIPQLRFPEFSGEWEDGKLGNYGNLINGLTYSPDNIVDEGLLVLRSSNVQNGQIYLNDNVYVNLDVDDTALTREDDILICVRNGSKRLIGKSTIINKNLPKSTHGAFMTVFRGESNKFISHWFHSSIYYKEVHKNLGATINSINGSNLKKFKTIFPAKSEQQKIASFLTAVDTKIEQLSKKQALLGEYKKGLTQQIFSQAIRFKADDGSDFPDWEEKRLGSVGQIVTGKTPSTNNPELWDGDISFITPTDITEQGKYQTKTQRTITKQRNTKLLPIGSIAYTCIASIGKMMITTNNSSTNQQINSIIVNDDFNNEFVYYALLKLTPYIKSTQANTTLPIINKTEFSGFKIQIPSLQEQTKIAIFLSSIDRKIEQVGKQLDESKQFKKALLQQMFV